MAVETVEYLAMLRRMLRAAGKRVADADEVELAALLALRAELDQAIATAAVGQHATGRSWQTIGAAAGMTKQAAHERWGRFSRAQ